MNLGMESETVEHKRSTSEMREAMESVASILNKHGSGSLYFGVRPSDGEVVGQDVSEKTLRDISQAFTNCIEPRVVPTIERFETDDGRAYVKVVFSGEDRPYACNGRYRIRSADEDLPMGAAILEQMMLERAERRESWDGRPSGKGIGDVAPGIVRRIVESGAARDRIPEPYTTDEAALGGLGLIAQDGSLTNAAAILFCKGGSPFRLTMGAVAGNDAEQSCRFDSGIVAVVAIGGVQVCQCGQDGLVEPPLVAPLPFPGRQRKVQARPALRLHAFGTRQRSADLALHCRHASFHLHRAFHPLP